MLVKKYKLIKKILILFFLLFNINYTFSFADTINEIKITGNKRITNETIILFSGVNINQNIDENELNEITKNKIITSIFGVIAIGFVVLIALLIF